MNFIQIIIATALSIFSMQICAVTPIRGKNVKLGKSPGGDILRQFTTGADNNINLTGLARGNYELTVEGGKTQIVQVGADGRLNFHIEGLTAIQNMPANE
jgi:hypothetical protein